jgi:copper chaperone CopZ
MTTVTYYVPSINCGGCVRKIETKLSGLQGVQSVQAAANTKTVAVAFEAPASEAQIKTALAEINYPAVG